MQIMTATVGPLAGADDDNIVDAQALPGAGSFLLSGNAAVGLDADGIAEAQTLAGAGPVTLDGVLVTPYSNTAIIANPANITITSAGDDSGVVFSVYGRRYVANGNPYYANETIAGTNAGVAVSVINDWVEIISVTADGATANDIEVGVGGYVAVLDQPRRVLMTSAGDDSGTTFTIYGTNWQGLPIQEDVAGTNQGTAYTDQDFQTVTAVLSDAATASTVDVGTNGIASSRPLFLDRYAFAPTSLQVVVSGTVNFTIQQTLDDPTVINVPGSLSYDEVTWFAHPDSALASATASAQGNYAYIPAMTRILLNSGDGVVTYKVLQAASTTGPT